VIGFSTPGLYSPALESSAFRVLGRGPEPAAIDVDPFQLISRSSSDFPSAPYDGLLVRVRGQLIEQVRGAEEDFLALRYGGMLFRARLARHGGVPSPTLANGSLLELTGVCTVRTDESREPKSFELQLRSPADVRVVQAPPWWNLEHTLAVLGVALGTMAATLGWIVLLRRRVRAQTGMIRQQLDAISRSEATLHVAQEQLRDALAREEAAARVDFLTGLNNRRAFAELAGHEVERARRYGRPIALAFIDLDRFKDVNDTLGHAGGDQVLGVVGTVIRSRVRATDLSARVGGDEFAVLLPETDPVAAEAALHNLRSRLLEAMRSNSWPVTFSIGLVVYERAPEAVEDLMREADQLMYGAKRNGGDAISMATRLPKEDA
jgi:diguanylate cyclase (GGDEF)-like protein